MRERVTTTLPGESMTSKPSDSGNVRLFIQNISEFLIGSNAMLIIQNWLKMLALRITSFKEIRGNFACGIRNPGNFCLLNPESTRA